jgi:hypothetical protein
MYYPIKLDKIRNFRYGMKAISVLEKKLKKSVSKIDLENSTMEDLATIIWAGLQHEDKDLTPDKVMDLIDEHSDIQTAFTVMGEAFRGAFGTGEDEEAKKIIEHRAEQFFNEKTSKESEKNA